MISTKQITRFVTVAAVLATAGAALTAVAYGLGALPPARAYAVEAPGPAVLGVDPATAISLGPEVAVEDKFDEVVVTSVSAGASKALMAPLKKASAPKKATVVAKPAKRTSGRAASRSGWRTARVSWYGPGFYGHTMAGGGTLRPDSMVCAHRSLPFGTRIVFKYKGRSVTAVVQDRGPYVSGRTFDLGPGTAKALGFGGVGNVQYRIVGR